MPTLRSMTAVYLRRGDQYLLLHREGGRVANNTYTGSAGGHFEPNELSDPRACLLRELREELAVTESMIADLTLRYITLRSVSGEVRQNYYFFADLLREPEGGLYSNEGSLRWTTLDAALTLPMPFTAAHMLAHYAQVGRFDHTLYGGIATADSVTFTPMGEA